MTDLSMAKLVGYVRQPVTGDWSEMVLEDRAENRHVLLYSCRASSSYKLTSGQKLWIITSLIAA